MYGKGMDVDKNYTNISAAKQYATKKWITCSTKNSKWIETGIKGECFQLITNNCQYLLIILITEPPVLWQLIKNL
jgi:hypothetical protein